MTVSELIIAISVGVFVASAAEAIITNAINYFVNKRLRAKYQEQISRLQEAVLKEAEEAREGLKTEEKI